MVIAMRNKIWTNWLREIDLCSPTIYLRVFGVNYMVTPDLIDIGRKVFAVHPQVIIPFIPGFIVGAPYAICPLSKILKKIGCAWNIKKFVRIREGVWKYEFQYLDSDWTVEMVVMKDYGKTF